MVADDSENSERHDANPGQPRQAVLRGRDIIPYAQAKGPDKVIIPKFDLARDIMAPQRKTTAEKRQGPAEKPPAEKLVPAIGRRNYRLERLQPRATNQDKVLAEIVARDIARLCSVIPLKSPRQRPTHNG